MVELVLKFVGIARSVGLQIATSEVLDCFNQMKLIDIVRQFTKNRTLVFNNLAFAANAFLTTSLLTWLPTYYHRIEMLPIDK